MAYSPSHLRGVFLDVPTPPGGPDGAIVEKELAMRTPSPNQRFARGRVPVLALAIALALGGITTAQAQNIQGAIFTSTSDGTVVNGNNYDSKLDVYLNGGPQNCISPGLPAGQYYYQVTNPSGSVLLSLDSVFDRKFEVTPFSAGKIGVNLGTHPSGTSPCGIGNITVRLAITPSDYANTDNHGGVYKAWVTRVEDFDAICGGVDCGLEGFRNSNTKTDNFRVKSSAPLPPPPEELLGELEAFKYYDTNVDGVYDPGIDWPLANWPMTLSPALGPNDATQLTSGSGTALWVDLPEDTYTVTEGEPDQTNWYNTEPSGGTHLDDDTVLTPVSASAAVAANETAHVQFGNFCIAPSGGHTLGFWSNKNGQARMADDGSMEPELALLRSYHLRTATGADFDPVAYGPFKTWLLDGTATNMSYMLSVQLAAMVLNIEAGIVDPNALYLPYNGTVGELVAAADAALAADGFTPAGDPNRGTQAQLKTWIDALNNNAGVVPTTPCSYTFTDPVITTVIAP
jgi:hypothetical protein